MKKAAWIVTQCFHETITIVPIPAELDESGSVHYEVGPQETLFFVNTGGKYLIVTALPTSTICSITRGEAEFSTSTTP